MDTSSLAHSGHRPRPDPETSHGCYEGWVYLGFEGEDENGELLEVVIERVPCRRCRPEAAENL